jgi:hypothetical protein
MHIAVISAHGEFKRDDNVAGIYCGRQFTTGGELDIISPLIIFSSCEVSPKAVGSPGIIDELFHHGAVAIAGTLTPIQSLRNAFFLERLFAMLAHFSAGDVRMDFLEVWTMTLDICSAFDVVFSDARARKALSDRSVAATDLTQQFQNIVTTSMTREVPVYETAARALEQLGFQVPSPDFRQFVMPETLAYTLYGWPENILV